MLASLAIIWVPVWCEDMLTPGYETVVPRYFSLQVNELARSISGESPELG